MTRWTIRMIIGNATPFPKPVRRTSRSARPRRSARARRRAMPDRQRHERRARRGRHVAPARAGCRPTTLPATRPTPAPVQSSPKPKRPVSSVASARKISETLTSPIASIVESEGDEHGHERARATERGEALAEVAPVPAPDRPLALQEPGGMRSDEGGPRTANVAAFIQYARSGPEAADDRAAEERADGGRRQSVSCSSAFAGEVVVVDEVRQPGEHRRPEERVADARDHREGDDRGRVSTNGSAANTASRPRSEATIRHLRESRSTSGPDEEPDDDPRDERGDEERADPPGRVRAVVDVDGERDQREPVADPRAERRERRAGGSRPSPEDGRRRRARGRVPRWSVTRARARGRARPRRSRALRACRR